MLLLVQPCYSAPSTRNDINSLRTGNLPLGRHPMTTLSGVGTGVHLQQEEQSAELCKQHPCRQQGPGSERQCEYIVGAKNTREGG